MCHKVLFESLFSFGQCNVSSSDSSNFCTYLTVQNVPLFCTFLDLQNVPLFHTFLDLQNVQ